MTTADRSPRLATTAADAVVKALAEQDITVPAEAPTGRVTAELDRVHARLSFR